MTAFQANLVGLLVVAEDVGRVGGEELGGPPEEERWLRVTGSTSCELDTLYVNRRAIPLIAHTRLPEVAVEKVSATRTDTVEDWSLPHM